MAHHHLSSSLLPCLRSLSRPVASTSSVLHRRSIHISPPRRNDASVEPTTPTPESAVEAEAPPVSPVQQSSDEGQERSEKGPTTYRQFMDQIGDQYQRASTNHWLKKSSQSPPPDSPFPMNPSFKPPPPLSDFQKDIIFNKFLADPLLHSPRRLAQRYNLSLKRVDAILRLKGLERHFVKGLPLQTGFQIGMDRLLNAYTHPALRSNIKDASLEPTEPRVDVSQIDALEQEEKRDAARYRYERLYWESTPEDGREPMLPGILESAKTRALLEEKSKKQAATRMLKGRLPNNPWITRPPRSSFVAWRRGRVATRFVDVGADFLTIDDLLKGKALKAVKRTARKSKTEAKKRLVEQLKLELEAKKSGTKIERSPAMAKKLKRMEKKLMKKKAKH